MKKKVNLVLMAGAILFAICVLFSLDQLYIE